MLLPDDLIIRNNCSKEMMRYIKKLMDLLLPQKELKEKQYQDGEFYRLKIKKKDIFKLKTS